VPPAEPDGLGAADAGCAWHLVRRDGEGPRCLLQLWEAPPPAVLDQLREAFLQRFSRAEALDPGPCHLGCDGTRAWFLQELGGLPLDGLWGRADAADRAGIRARLVQALAGSRVPRLLLPGLVRFAAGRVLAPRVLGLAQAPWDGAGLLARLDQMGPAGPGGGPRPWAEPPDLADRAWLPLDGRAQELTYLKSLMFGLGAALPMERVVLLLGEAGLGHDPMCDWAAAAAETEGLWVTSLELFPGERAGTLLERLLQALLSGLEADLYAARPTVARALARRVANFAFLGGGRLAPGDRPLEAAERHAALEAIGFAQAWHPRLVVLRGLDRGAEEVPELLEELVLAGRVPWILAAADPGRNPELNACLERLGRHPVSATVVLKRLEDADLLQVLERILGAHALPAGFLAQLAAACLGNPGLLRSILEQARAQGLLLWRDGAWRCAPDRAAELAVEPDLVAGVLEGRLGRLSAEAQAVVRCLALADGPLDAVGLGQVLDLDGDGLEAALQAAVAGRLALVAGGAVRVAGPLVRNLVLDRMCGPEQASAARLLLRLLGAQGGRVLLAVRLQALAQDRATALAQAIQAIQSLHPGRRDGARVAPEAAERVVWEALALDPDPGQEARLWEFLADAWEDGVGEPRAAEAGADPASAPGGAPAAGLAALAAMDRAIQALGALAGWKEEEHSARLHRKRALLALRLRRPAEAQASLATAAALLADHPFHPEQPRMRLAAGRLGRAQGDLPRAMAALDEGLDLSRRLGTDPGHPDQAALLLELSLAQGEAARGPEALAALEGLYQQAEQAGDPWLLARVLDGLGRVRAGLGQTAQACADLEAALGLAGSMGRHGLQAACALRLGICLSWRQLLGPALDHLARALAGFERLGDRAGAARARIWQARDHAALGDHGLAELMLLQGADTATGLLRPGEQAERAFLDAELAGFRDHWGEARRHYHSAANRFAHAGMAWGERLARLRGIQAEAQELADTRPGELQLAWGRLQLLQAAVAQAGSPWLELEWRRALAHLLAAEGLGAARPERAVQAWGEVLAGARQLQFPAMALEAAARGSELLLGLGERLGARSRILDALPAAMELWAHLPEGAGPAFLVRSDIHGFRQAAAKAGVPVAWPDPATSQGGETT
jgi:tetratricopeptide (TPR) repeat protein